MATERQDAEAAAKVACQAAVGAMRNVHKEFEKALRQSMGDLLPAMRPPEDEVYVFVPCPSCGGATRYASFYIVDDEFPRTLKHYVSRESRMCQKCKGEPVYDEDPRGRFCWSEKSGPIPRNAECGVWKVIDARTGTDIGIEHIFYCDEETGEVWSWSRCHLDEDGSPIDKRTLGAGAIKVVRG